MFPTTKAASTSTTNLQNHTQSFRLKTQLSNGSGGGGGGTKKSDSSSSSSSSTASHHDFAAKLSCSFNRTSTLPRRFKEKFFIKSSSTTSPSNQNGTSANNCAAAIVQHTSPISLDAALQSPPTSPLSADSVITTTPPPSSTSPSAFSPDLEQAKLFTNLDKLYDNFTNTLKHLEQIIIKNKYEIISSNSTAILESILDIYNLIESHSPSSTSSSSSLASAAIFTTTNDLVIQKQRANVNKSLANLIKWSDSILFKLSFPIDDADPQLDHSKLLKQSTYLIKHMQKHMSNLIEVFKNLSSTSRRIKSGKIIDKPAIGSNKRPNSLNQPVDLDHNLTKSTSSVSLSSSLSNMSSSSSSASTCTSSPSVCSSTNSSINPTSSCSSSSSSSATSTMSSNLPQTTTTATTQTLRKSSIETTTISKSINDSVTQTTTFSTSCGNSNSSQMSAFVDLDRLALELSQLSEPSPNSTSSSSNSFTNDQCNYLLSQFESFAKQFNANSTFDFGSKYSTIKTNASSSITSTSSSSSTKKTTIYTKSTFEHDLDDKICQSESIESDFNDILLQKTTDIRQKNKSMFIETSLADANNQPELSNVLFNSITNEENDKESSSRSSSTTTSPKSNTPTPTSSTTPTVNPPISTNLDYILFDSAAAVVTQSNGLNPNFLSIDDEEEEDVLDLEEELKKNLEKTSLFIKNNNTSNLEDQVVDDEYDVNDYNDSILNLNSSSIKTITTTTPIDDNAANINDYINDTFLNLDETIIVPNRLKSACLSRSSTDSSSSSSSSSCSSSSTSSVESPYSKLKNSSNNKIVTESNGKENELDVLSLLDVSHLLEYQSHSSLGSTVSIAHSSHNILRGGHIDALIVLATSANSSVLAANTNNGLFSPLTSSSFSGSTSSNGSSRDRINKSNFLFQEAFLTTYRTIIEPIDLINKLIYRYSVFAKYKHDKDGSQRNKYTNQISPISKTNPSGVYDYCANICNVNGGSTATNSTCEQLNEKFDLNRLKTNIKTNKMVFSAARNSLTLLVRLIDELGNELSEKIMQTLTNFIIELLLDDELQMARLLRKKLLIKLEKKCIEDTKKRCLNSTTTSAASSTNCATNNNCNNCVDIDGCDGVATSSSTPTTSSTNITVKSQTIPYSSVSMTKRSYTLLDFKSSDLAEQITLIDLNLFLKIDLSEVLLWSTKQSEKYSPNLIQFTEHFNNISYWARSRILEHENPREREKYIVKFLKVMKHLRKMNNFNSYLSILSAVDSGPVQRLDWPKHITDSIKEFSALIDPKSGFKCLREAVAEAHPPCIPHIGLILQDLTILHIANHDYLPSGNCNFWKRWQQFNILERLRYFRRCNYDFKTNMKVQEFFNNFENFMGEEAQYTQSEQLKPRSRNH